MKTIDEFAREIDEQRETIWEAVQAGIAERYNPRDPDPLTDAERAAVGHAALRVAEFAVEEAGITVEQAATFAKGWATRLASDRLLAKTELAVMVEYDASNGYGLPNGVLGQAIDEAVARLLPYATAHVGWYVSEVG